MIMQPIKSLVLLATLLAPLAQASELPAAIQAVEGRGAKVVGTFEAPGGLQGYAARYNGQGLALYLTPDGEHVLIGTLLDAKGADLTAEPLERLVYKPLGEEMWQRLQSSTWIADGDDKASRVVYVFSDPNCPYCNLFWRQARPWIEAGRVQLRHVMVGMLRADSPGKAAALLAAQDPRQALGEHEAAGRESKLQAVAKIPGAIAAQLDANLALMGEMGGEATPAIYYLDERGRLQQHKGAPRPDSLEAIMGSAKP